MGKIISVLGYVWALPVSLVGMAVALADDTKLALRDAQWVFHFVCEKDSFVGKWFKRNGFAAITIGTVIIYKDFAVFGNMKTRKHELRHVQQVKLFGPLFPLFYFGSSAVVGILGKNQYKDNPFEVDARKAAE